MKKSQYSLFFVIVLGLFVFAQRTEASNCRISPEITGASFENFESAEYVNGLLVLHFKLSDPYEEIYPIEVDKFYFSDECQNGAEPSATHKIYLTRGIKLFSVRFISPTKYEIWNDETNSKESCDGCQGEIWQFPSYYQASFFFRYFKNYSDSFISGSHYVTENPKGPPVKDSTLEPSKCPASFSVYGTYYDNYEKAEYIEGLLVYHFRLNPPRNYGQNWYMNFSLFDENCAYGADYGHAITPGNFSSTSIKPGSRYYSVRFSSPTHYDIWNDETEAKELCASCSIDIPSKLPNNSDAKIFTIRFSVPGGMWGDSFLFSSYFPIVQPKPKRNPVIIIPGMIGSELYDGDDLIWIDPKKIKSEPLDKFLQVLILDEFGYPKHNISVGGVITNINGTKIFSELIDELISEGYSTSTSLFLFPYDWRINLDRTKDLLMQTINDIRRETNSEKVDIVVHSMGGLLIKDYINEYGKDKIDKLVFVGTPHLGAPESTRSILWGDDLHIPFFLLIKSRIQEIAVNSPAMYELLPNKKYFEKLSGYIRPFSWIFNKNLYNYDETKSYILKKGGNRNVFEQAESFFDKNLDTIDLSGINAYNVVGCKVATPISYKLSLTGRVGTISYGPGDGTVPLGSADYLNIPTSNKFYIKGVDHSELPSTRDVRETILNILLGRSATTTANFSNDFSLCGIKGKFLTWHSPVDVHVYDANGNHAGPIENEGIEYGIPGANYIVSGHDKFIFLPTDENQQYRIEGIGADSGTFDLLISEYDNSEVITTDVFNDIPVSTSTPIRFDVSATSTDNSILVNDESIVESAGLTAEQSDDVTPPQTEILINGNNEIKKWYKSSEITLNAVDDNSGILETKYSLDGSNYFDYTSPILITDEGTTTIGYYSIDRAGNDEEIKTVTIHIDKTPPEIKTYFDIVSESIKFDAFDNLDDFPSISCTNNSCQAIDGAGNKTVISFKLKNNHGDYEINFDSINYNGILFKFPENEFEIDYDEKNRVVKIFKQEWGYGDDERIRIEYKKSKDESYIKKYGEKGNAKTIKMPGIKFLQVVTNKGKILAVIE